MAIREHVVCGKCQGEFQASSDQQLLIEKARSKGQKLVALQCPLCSRITSFDPSLEASPPIPEGAVTQDNEIPYRCPVSGCVGWVSFVPSSGEERSFWGCGECGSIWYEEKNLQMEIGRIIAEYSYRKSAYRKEEGNWKPVVHDEQPSDYEDLVNKEPDGMKKSFVRG